MLQAESNLGGDRLQALDPYVLRDHPPRNEDALGIFAYDPARVELV
jgi:salicylate hydroxylase